MSKAVPLSLRIDAGLKARMEAAASVGPYAITLTSIVERGIVLALAELETLRAPAVSQ